MHVEQQWSDSGPSTTHHNANSTSRAQHVVFQRITTHKQKHEFVVAQKDGCLDMEIAEISASLPAAAYVGELLKQ